MTSYLFDFDRYACHHQDNLVSLRSDVLVHPALQIRKLPLEGIVTHTPAAYLVGHEDIGGISLALQGLPPMLFFIWMTGLDWQMMIFIPALVFYLLYLLIWRKIQGYTGDCCGAVCLLVELAVYLVVCAINFMNPL